MSLGVASARVRARRVVVTVVVAAALSMAGGLSLRVLASATLGVFAPGVEGEIWQQLLPAFGQPLDASCTNSGTGTVCGANNSPPPLGEVLYPIGVATDGGNIFITDQFNNRIQEFAADGTPVALTVAIGKGLAGDGPQLLNQPEGLAIDAAHKLITGDSLNGRVAVFNADGSFAFELRDIDSSVPFTIPTGVAVSPGTTLTNRTHAQDPTDTKRFVVTDKYNSYVYIYDSDLHPVGATGRIGTGLGTSADGDFSSPTGAAIDGQGHIYIADLDNSRVNIYDLNGVYLGKFGTPPATGALPPDALQSPYAVTIDPSPLHNGRVIVSDTGNQRLSFYTVVFAPLTNPTPPAVTYLFSIDAGGTLNGYPRGLAVDISSDPLGKLLVADTVNNRIQRFQVPDLAVVQITTNGLTNTGTFGVVVPVGKPDVLGVTPLVVPTNATLVGQPIPQPPAPNTPTQDISAGQIVNYAFNYAPTGLGQVSFVITATGNGTATTSPPVTATATVPCTTCATTIQILNAPVTVPPVVATPTNTWYTRSVAVRITATSTSATGLSKIGYKFVSGPELAVQPGIHFSPPLNGAARGTFDVIFTEERRSQLEYWAVNTDGTEQSPHGTITVGLDLSAPNVTFFFPPPNAAGWWNAALSVPVSFSDSVSGATLVSGGPLPLQFAAEGRALSRTVIVRDGAGHTTTAVSNDVNLNGLPVNIDMTPPTLTAPAAITLAPTSPAGATLAAGQFQATARDPNLTSGAAGSGVNHITNPTTGAAGTIFPLGTTTWSFVATDNAGNQSAAKTSTVTVQVAAAPPTISVSVNPALLWPPNHKLVTVTATITASDPSGKAPTIALESITSSERDNGLGDGDIADDIQGETLHTDDRVFKLRAERSGRGPGRIYTIKYSATGPTGLKSTATAFVIVPHDMGDGDDHDGDDCHGQAGHGHHDGDGCDEGHHGHFDGDNCQGRDGYHHTGDGDKRKG